MGRDPKYMVGTLEKTLAILEVLKSTEGPIGVTAIAESIGASKSVVHNHLKTLEANGYVVGTDDGRYNLGLRFLDLGESRRQEMELFQHGTTQVENLAEETGELVNLAIMEHRWCVYLYQSQGDQAVELDTYAGFRTTLHNTALGKAMLAHLLEEERDAVIDQRGLPATTENTITDRHELYEELETVRRKGYAVDREERLNGLRCLAAPVLSEEGQVLGALSVSGPTSRFSGERWESELPERVENAANVLEIQIAFG